MLRDLDSYGHGEEYPFDEAHPVPLLVSALRRLCERAIGCALSEVSEPNC